MSDIQENPSWWQAPDGRWYPPELASTDPANGDEDRAAKKYNRVLKRKEAKQSKPLRSNAGWLDPNAAAPDTAAVVWLIILALVGTVLAIYLLTRGDSSERPAIRDAVSVGAVSGEGLPLKPTGTQSSDPIGDFFAASFGTTRRLADDWYVTVTDVEDTGSFLAVIQEPDWDPALLAQVVVVRLEVTYIGPLNQADALVPVEIHDAFSTTNPYQYPSCQLNPGQPQATQFPRGVPTQHTVCLTGGHPSVNDIEIRVFAPQGAVGGTRARFSATGGQPEQVPPGQ